MTCTQLYTDTDGTLTQDGKAITGPGRDRGMVFQSHSLFPWKTVLGNIMHGPLMSGQSRINAEGTARTFLELVGLSAYANSYPKVLSGGMKQRLAIAQALLGRPRILLLDEPFGALDPGIRADMHELVLALWREYKLTIFMVTHDLKEGFYLGTRLWVFDKLRHDPHAPQRFGAGITYDLPVGKTDKSTYQEISNKIEPAALIKA